MVEKTIALLPDNIIHTMFTVKRFLSQSHGVLRASSMPFSLRITGAMIAFATQIVIARFFGANDLGQYLLMLALANIIANIIPLGYQVMGPYFIFAYRSNTEHSQLKRYLFEAYKRLIISSFVVIVAGCFLLFSDVGLFSENQLVLLEPALFLAPAMALIFMNSSVLIGVKKPVQGTLPDMLLRPLTFLAFAIVLVIFDHPHILGPVFWVAVIFIWVIALGHLVLTSHNLPAFPDTLPNASPEESRKWRRLALPWLFIILVTEFILDLDILLLGSLLSVEELAIFGVCLRLFAIFGFAVNAIYMIVLPEMYSAGMKKNREGFLEQLRLANTLATLAACACLLSAIFLGEAILNVFGKDFLEGHWILIVLMLALVIRTIFGPAHIVLSLYDYPYAALPVMLLGLLILLTANFTLVPLNGLLGGAVALFLAYASWSVMLWYLTRIKTGLDISLFASLRK